MCWLAGCDNDGVLRSGRDLARPDRVGAPLDELLAKVLGIEKKAQ